VDVLVRKAVRAYQSGNWRKAKDIHRRILRKQPKHVDALYLLGSILAEEGDLKAGEAFLQKALAVKPDSPMIHANLGNLYAEKRDQLRADRHFERAIELAPNTLEAYIGLAQSRARGGDLEAAFETMDFAEASGGKRLQTRLVQANLHAKNGDCETAHGILAPLLEAHPDDGQVVMSYTQLVLNSGFAGHRDRQTLAEAVRLAEAVVAVSPNAALYFSLGQLKERLGDHGSAFRDYERGNRLADRRMDKAAEAHKFAAARATFARDRYANLARARTKRDARPIFLVGMPRSGSSLAEQILASHPAVGGLGEYAGIRLMADDLPGLLGTKTSYPECIAGMDESHCDALAERYLSQARPSRPEARCLTDKSLANHSYLGLISLLFPEARVIHCLRDPLDTCISCFFNDFHGEWDFCYDLESLGWYYREYRALMDFWAETLDLPILDLSYETLVEEPEPTVRRLLSFLELPWDDACLEFHRNRRFVATLSHHQVRQPLYRSSMGRHQPFGPWLGPLRAALGDIATA
jgi:tetratricopeptide (TPR) repeat protein